MAKLELKVFIASPGGLEGERDAVEKICSELNAGIGDWLQITLSPRRYESMPARPGRPQGQINPLIDESDIVIAILHRRWGSPSGNGAHSGFSEEFFGAIERYEATGSPIVSLHFKNVDAESERDPGPQLAQVLSFRRRIEGEYIAMYNTFDSVDEFKLNVLNLLLSEMTRRQPERPGESLAVTQGRRSNGMHPRDTDEGSAPIQINGISGVLQSFAEELRGESHDEPLDQDRLQLFSLAVSRDKEAPPTHLVNRIYQRRSELKLSTPELRALLRAYLCNVGLNPDEEQRVVPFVNIVGRDWLVSELEKDAHNILRSDEPGEARGCLRLLIALNLRPRMLWSTFDDTAHDVSGLWESVAKVGLLGEAIRYWALVALRDDLAIATALAESDDKSARHLGSVGRSLIEKSGSIDPLVAIDASLLANEEINLRLGGNPFGALSQHALEDVIIRESISHHVRECALAEMASRDCWTQKVVRFLFQDDTLATFRGPSVRRTGRGLLGQTKMAETKMSILSEAERRGEDGKFALRAIVASSPELREFIGFDAAKLVAAGKLEETFEIFANDESLSDVAWKLVDGELESFEVYHHRLRGAGLEEKTLEFVRESAVSSALEYLIYSQPKINNRVRNEIRSRVRDEAILTGRYINLLELVAQDQDVPVILEHSGYAMKSAPSRLARLLNKSSLRGLRALLSSSEGVVVAAALSELVRRKRPPSDSHLRQLMRHNSDRVRFIATRAVVSRTEDLDELMKSYVQEEPRYFYNVIWEIDRESAGLPTGI